MSKKFMPELPDKDRVMILQQNADKVEVSTYQKPLSEEDLQQRREILTENSIKLGDLEEEKKELTKSLKERIDPLRAHNKQILLEIRTKQQKAEGVLYHMANHEDSVMETYDENGDFISSRRLRPEEKQVRMTMSVAN